MTNRSRSAAGRRSRLYQGTISHRRLRPTDHAFTYRVYYLLADLDELEMLDTDLRWFSWNRFNLLSLHASDHGAADGSSLRTWADVQLLRAGIDPHEVASIQLLAFPRVLGYVFNPLSIWYCRNAADDLIAVIHEVRNTFGDKHAYVVPRMGGEAGGSRAHEFPKAMHVSPLMPMDQTYRFGMNDPAERLNVAIRQFDADGEIFRASLTANRVAITDRSLLRLFVTHPLVTLKSIIAIHYEAFRVWRKGVRFHRRPEPGVDPVSVVDRRSTPVRQSEGTLDQSLERSA